MLPTINHTVATMLLLLLSLTASSQSFYVNTGLTIQARANSTYKLSTQTCDTLKDSISLKIHTCPATYQPHIWTDSTYNDMAIDKNQNIYYVTMSGFLYKRKLSDTASCQYIGDFTSSTTIISGLVADTTGTLYAAGNAYDTCTIYKYDSTGFSVVGKLPKGVYCSGDLFFYEHRLFMTCANPDMDSFFLYEIVLADPKQSCYYMPLKNLHGFGAFSVKGNFKTRVYVSANDTVTFEKSSMVEIDIPTKKILDTFCNYPFLIRGAAAYYEFTGDSTKCPYIPKSIAEADKVPGFIKIYNPATGNIRINTNVSKQEIRDIRLYDLYGKKIKTFLFDSFPGNLNISDIPDGLYLIHITAKDGRQWNEKVLKAGGW